MLKQYNNLEYKALSLINQGELLENYYYLLHHSNFSQDKSEDEILKNYVRTLLNRGLVLES